MKLSTVLFPKGILLHVSFKSIDETISKLVKLADFDLKTAQEITRLVQERENLCSTSIGKGILLPHCRTKLVKKFTITVVRLEEPINYGKNGEEDKLAQLFFLLIAPYEATTDTLKILSKLAKLGKKPDVLDTLMAVESTQEFLEEIISLDD